MGLTDVAKVLRPLLQQTQDHVRDLRGALGRLRCSRSTRWTPAAFPGTGTRACERSRARKA